MSKLKHSFVAKVTATFLYALFVISTCFSGASVIGSYCIGLYSVPPGISFSDAMYRLGYSINSGSLYPDIAGYMYNARYWSIALLVLSVVLLIITYIFLISAAGHKADHEEIVLGFFDRVPLDIVAALDTFLIALGVLILMDVLFDYLYRLMNYYGYYSGDELLLLIGAATLVILAMMLIFLAFSATFAARAKAGKWWRNTVIFFILRYIWRGLKIIAKWAKRIFMAIPILWKFILGSIVFVILNIMFISQFFDYYDDFWLLPIFIIDSVVFIAFLIMAYQLTVLKKSGEKLASGNFDYKTDTGKLFWDFKRHGENLNSIADGMSSAVEQRIRSERLKTELITNVSHDIKTPLTSIVNYVDLLKKPHTEEEGQAYLEVLSRQSERLKRLTLDLVEASKASTGNLAVNLVPINSSEILNQACAEYAARFADAGLTPVLTLPDPPVSIMADGQHLWRVLDNLLGNAVKYSQPGTRLYIDLEPSGIGTTISIKNISRDRLNVSPDELMERFVRGDSSRHTEGSGLGLAITRSLTELMGGHFNLSIDGDLFKAEVWLRTQ